MARPRFDHADHRKIRENKKQGEGLPVTVIRTRVNEVLLDFQVEQKGPPFGSAGY